MNLRGRRSYVSTGTLLAAWISALAPELAAQPAEEAAPAAPAPPPVESAPTTAPPPVESAPTTASPPAGAAPAPAPATEPALLQGAPPPPASTEPRALPAPPVAAPGGAPPPAPADAAAASASPEPAEAPNGRQVDQIVFEPGKGLSFTSRDEEFSLSLRLRGQFLYTLERVNAADDWSHLLQIRRARLTFVGHVFGEHNKYKTELAISPRDENVSGSGPTLTPLLDWYAEFDYVKHATLRIGQYKVPFSRQRVISSGDLQMVDRALAQGEFNLDRDIGFHFHSPGIADLFRYYAGIWFNQGRDADTFNDDFDQMYIARVELLPFGDFEDYSEGDLERMDKPGLSVGAAYAYLDDATADRGILGSAPADGGTTDVHLVTADATFKLAGVSLSGEFFYRQGDRNGGGAVDELGAPIPVEVARNGVGWFLQGGYLLAPAPVEFTARYSEVRPTGDDSSLEQQHELGAGVSFYPGEHSLKLQADYFRIWPKGGIDQGDDQIRAQLQLAY